MGKEIERKFLVKNDSWRGEAPGVLYRQGYLSLDMDRVVRVRVNGKQGYLTIKGKFRGFSRPEFEYEIPYDDALELLNTLCIQPILEKMRYIIEHRGVRWEIDEFLKANSGLVVAEVELDDEEQSIDLPDWVGREVSHDPRYFNSNLILKPFKHWKTA